MVLTKNTARKIIDSKDVIREIKSNFNHERKVWPSNLGESDKEFKNHLFSMYRTELVYAYDDKKNECIRRLSNKIFNEIK